MTEAYDLSMMDIAKKSAAKIGQKLQEGIYLAMSGPSYETPAEIRMAAVIGADAVGMSTAPEVIAAKQCGIKVLGISCITNYAAGITNRPLSHEDVIQTAGNAREKFVLLIKEIISAL